MKLVGSYTSPYVRKIRIVLLEKNMPFEFVNDSPWEVATQVPDYNPLGKVPALVTDDGETLFDSPIIAEYLELLAVPPALLPAEPMAALRVKLVEALSDGVADAAAAVFKEQQRPAAQQSVEWIVRQQGKVERGLDALDAHVQADAWLCGDAISIADIAAGCLLGWLNLRFPENDWRARRPALARLVDQLFARPSFGQTTPPTA